MNFLYCQACQTTHPLTSTRCPSCGASLAGAPIVTIRPAAPAPAPSRTPTLLILVRIGRLFSFLSRLARL